MKQITIATPDGTHVILSKRDIYRRILTAAYEVAVTPRLYTPGLTEIRRYMLEIMNPIYDGHNRYVRETGSRDTLLPRGWRDDFEELLGQLIATLNPSDIGKTGIQLREHYVLRLAEEYRCSIETPHVIRLCTYLNPVWIPDGTVSMKRITETEVGKLLSRGLDYQAQEGHVILLAHTLRRLAVDSSHTYKRDFIICPGTKIVAVTLNPNSGHRTDQWQLDYTLLTFLKFL